ncbi:hypothetical protein IFR05_004227 [Cadophora sp. M221]|nr:hypothetical protein IFR05_004227 [Cadophora sp. M221]
MSIILLGVGQRSNTYEEWEICLMHFMPRDDIVLFNDISATPQNIADFVALYSMAASVNTVALPLSGSGDLTHDY